MKKILLIATVYRVGERIYPIIPSLSKLADIDVLFVNEMSNEMEWYGDKDPRNKFYSMYGEFITDKFYGHLNSNKQNFNDFDVSKYDLVLYDDNRNRYDLDVIYEKCKKNNIPVAGCTHGTVSRNFAKEFHGKVFDYMFVFGNNEYKLFSDFDEVFIKGGIPANDALKKYKRNDEYILVIVNYLGNRACPFPVKFDGNLIEKTGLIELQREFNKKVLFKLKSRLDHPFPDKDITYLKSIVPSELEYEYMIDCEGDDNSLISDSFITISAPGTMSLKSIQKGIPTIMVKDSGQNDFFNNYKGLLPLDTQLIFDEIERQHNVGRDIDFISNVITGGENYNSTEVFVNKLMEI